MDIQLGQYRNINSVNVDNNNRIKLQNKINNFDDNEMLVFVSSSDIFNYERNKDQIYRLYGSLEYFSILNGLPIKTTYQKTDLFKSNNETYKLDSIEHKNIINSFEIYVVIADDNNTLLYDNYFQRNFKVIAKLNDISIQNMGFDTNIFGDSGYYYQTNKDINIIDLIEEYIYVVDEDTVKFPIENVFLYFKYKQTGNEIIQQTQWTTDINVPTKTLLTSNSFNIDDHVYGDVMNINKSDYSRNVVAEQTYYIRIPVDSGSVLFKYNPFVSVKLRNLSTELYKQNVNSSSYDDVNEIPEYALKIDNMGNYVWRTIIEDDFYVTDNQYNIPFVNNRKYVFYNINLSIVPDLTDQNTIDVFKDIIITNDNDKYTLLNKKPLSDLNSLGRLCQI